jgi:type I restriction enzyme, S subunit
MTGPAAQLAQEPTDDWTIVPLRHLVTCIDGRRIPLNREQRSLRQGPYPYWGANGVVDHVDDFLFDEQLVLLGEDGAPFFDRSKPVAFLVSERVWVNNHMHVLRPGDHVDPRYLTYALNAVDYGPWIEGTTRDKLTQDAMGNIPVPLANPRVQPAIAEYLDAETARIDALVAARRAQMDLLKVRLRAAIDEQLDKVLVAWRLKHLLTGPLEYGASEAAGDDDPAWPRYVRTTDIDEDGGLRPETFRSLPPAVAAPYRLRGGDLLLTRSGATVGKSLLWQEKWGPACFAGYLIRARPDPHRVVPDYLAYFVRSSRYWDEIRLTTIQATIANVSAERYGDFRVPLPSLGEQVSIVRRLDVVRQLVQAFSQVMTSQVDVLLERRQALISAAVTGQLEIPEVAA